MKQNTFEPCRAHENGHYNWCLLCENEQLRKVAAERLADLIDTTEKLANAQIRNIQYLETLLSLNKTDSIQFSLDSEDGSWAILGTEHISE